MPRIVRRIRLLPVQAAFRRSKAIYRGFTGGRGAGKSWIGAHDLLMRAKPGRLYLVAAPTYKMLMDSSLRTFLERANDLHFLRNMNKSDMQATLGNGAQVNFRSTEDPEKLRGPNLSGVWFDEAGEMVHEAFKFAIPCLREGGEMGWLSATFTPKGPQHWTYGVFGPNGTDSELFVSPTRNNTFLPPGFEDTLRAQYTSQMAAQELEGKFVDMGGTVAKREWFRPLDTAPKCSSIVRAWDFAATPENAEKKGDYTAGAKVGKFELGWVVLDMDRSRVSAGQVISRVKTVAQQDGPSVSILAEQEGGSSGKIAYNYLARELAGFNVHPIRPSGDKMSRAMPFLAQAEAGNVYYVRGPWNDEWISELVAFPGGVNDDQVDATCHGFNGLGTTFVGFSMVTSTRFGSGPRR